MTAYMSYYHQQPQRRTTKPLPQIPAYEPGFAPSSYCGSMGLPPLSVAALPVAGPSPYSSLIMPTVQSRRHSYSEPVNTTETKYLITEGFTYQDDRRFSIDCESTKVEETVTQKPFDPSYEPAVNNSKLFQTPNTPDDLVVSTTTTNCLSPSTASPATPSQQTTSKIPSPWGSMVSLCLRDNDEEQAPPPAPPAAAPVPTAPKQQPPPLVESPTESPTAVKEAPSVTPAPQTTAQNSNEVEPSRFSCIVASYSLTHNKDAIKTYRRMAIKTRDKKVQMAYAKYLLDVAKLYEESATTRKRLMDEGAYWIARLAKRKIWEAVFLQGQRYLDAHQTAKAIRCFEKAAKNGWSPAYLALAAQAEVQGDWHKALACYRSADSHPEANYKMAMVLMNQNMSSIQVLEKAAEQGKSLESGKAALVLSHIYSHKIKTSDAVEKDDTRAFRYLKQAVQLNLVEAVCRMGQVYTYGLLKQQSDPWQGYQYFIKAAEEGYDLAMLELAKVYAKGIQGYLAQQPDSAFRWCQRAAERGLKDAEYTLGTYYETGIGVAIDYPRALEYFGKAASKGHVEAAEKLNRPVAIPAVPVARAEEEQHISSQRCTIM